MAHRVEGRIPRGQHFSGFVRQSSGSGPDDKRAPYSSGMRTSCYKWERLNALSCSCGCMQISFCCKASKQKARAGPQWVVQRTRCHVFKAPIIMVSRHVPTDTSAWENSNRNKDACRNSATRTWTSVSRPASRVSPLAPCGSHLLGSPAIRRAGGACCQTAAWSFASPGL